MNDINKIETNSQTYPLWNKIKAFIKQFFLIILYFLLTLIFVGMFYRGIKNDNLVISNLAYVLAELGMLIVFIFIFRKTLIPDYYDFKKDYKKYIESNFKYYLMGLAIMVISTQIITPFIGEADNQVIIENMANAYPFYIIITTIFIAPILEELLTRTAFKDVFKHPIFYYLLSALVFGSLHLNYDNLNVLEALYIIPYGSLGFVFAKMYNDSNNIWTNIFFHSFHNLITVAMMFIVGV